VAGRVSHSPNLRGCHRRSGGGGRRRESTEDLPPGASSGGAMAAGIWGSPPGATLGSHRRRDPGAAAVGELGEPPPLGSEGRAEEL
jgi:hypothetical protein